MATGDQQWVAPDSHKFLSGCPQTWEMGSPYLPTFPARSVVVATVLHPLLWPVHPSLPYRGPGRSVRSIPSWRDWSQKLPEPLATAIVGWRRRNH